MHGLFGHEAGHALRAVWPRQLLFGLCSTSQEMPRLQRTYRDPHQGAVHVLIFIYLLT